MEEITVGYSKKVATDNYGSTGVSGSVTFKPSSDDLQKEFDQQFAYLKLVLDAKIDELGINVARVAGPVANNAADETTAKTGDTSNSVSKPSNVGDGEILITHAKVFRVGLERGPQKVRGEIRIGHEDIEAHLAKAGSSAEGDDAKYITVKTWDPDLIEVIGSIRKVKDEKTGEILDMKTFNLKKGDFVDVIGKLTPWRRDETMFDINATSIRKYDE